MGRKLLIVASKRYGDYVKEMWACLIQCWIRIMRFLLTSRD